jgi:hypothetical protein
MPPATAARSVLYIYVIRIGHRHICRMLTARVPLPHVASHPATYLSTSFGSSSTARKRSKTTLKAHEMVPTVEDSFYAGIASNGLKIKTSSVL